MRILHRMPGAAAALLALACGLTSLIAAQPASAGAAKAPRPGQWTQVTGKLTNIDDAGLARGSDGVLHVLWTSGQTGSFRVQDTPVSASGVVGKAVTIQAQIFSANDPDATVTSQGVDAFWNEVKTSAPDATTGVFEAARPLRGGSWKLGPVTSTKFDWQSSESAAPGTGGTPWVDFVNAGGIGVHHTGSLTSEISFHTCCVNNAAIGTDSRTGAAWIMYRSFVPGHQGLFAQRVSASGHRTGPAVELPGSGAGGGPQTINQRVTATGLGGKRPGVYVVYQTGSGGFTRHVELFRLGSRGAVSLGSFGIGDQIGGATLAADPFGRLWVSWFRVIRTQPAIWVRRAKTGASGFGQVARISLPRGTTIVDKVYLSAQARKVDVVALLTVRGKTAYWTTQVLPPRQ